MKSHKTLDSLIKEILKKNKNNGIPASTLSYLTGRPSSHVRRKLKKMEKYGEVKIAGIRKTRFWKLKG